MSSPVGPGTAVVVTYNSGRTIGATLSSLAHAVEGLGWKLIVVDNDSADETTAVARAAGAEIIANPDNRGLAAANNQGLRTATGEWALLCNPDVQLRPDTVRALVDCAQRHPRAAFVVPRLLHPDGTGQVSAGSLPTLTQALLGHRWSLSRGGSAQSRQVWWEGWAHDTEMAIGHGAESCYLVRRAALAEIGLQDEAFWLDWEGVDWARRAGALGWEIWFTPAAVVVHEGGASVTTVKVRWIIATHKSLYRYFASTLPRPLRPPLATAVAARALLKLAVHFARVEVYSRSSAGSS